MKYQFIARYQQNYPVKTLCRILEVSVSGYYAWRSRPQSRRKQEDALIAEQVRRVFTANRQVYGSPRIHADLKEQGWRCGRKRVARLMREQGLCAHRRVHRTRTTKSEPGARIAPNLLDQDFTAARPNEKWAGDITAIWTYEGWL